MNLYSSMSTSSTTYSTAAKHQHHDTRRGMTQSASTSTIGHSSRMSEASQMSTQPPFFIYPAAKSATQDHSIYSTGHNHRILPPFPSSFANSDPSDEFPRTPPPARARGGFLVSPPAPLRITSCIPRYERIGPEHLQIYRLSLPPELKSQLDPLVAQAERFANGLSNGWHTDLYSLTKQDIALRDVPFASYKDIFDYICHAIRTLYGCQTVVVDKNQPHILKYSVDSGHTGVELHHDRCDVTANLALSRSSDYCGGGTYIPDTGSIIRLNHGECLLHPGSLVHGGMEVTKGTRYLMVTFAHLR